ncbi:GNAT family acetyltransferase [Penicillium robsamsonii]|uniref:GNAT family acetyltransferase n=1 Tax=Penicillium robsamsonii TaxID=1792511 RepID=UPI002549518A|nr:GNAT family acetyltransferase [Penicillium robsamsonii]KAJ5827476.1 GNAT family acetyltransferase [Penicillium robsamsonii]
MLAFDPSTDAITRNLFPPHLQIPERSGSEAIRQWSIARKSARLHAKGFVMMVAVGNVLDGKAVGYSMWFAPVEGDEEELPRPKRTFAGMDQAAFAELREIIMEDEQRIFGEKGAADGWTPDLDPLGVHPQYQKRGIGRMLLDWGVQQAVSQERDCYLITTPAGVALYRAAGFDAMKTVEIFGAPHVSMRKRAFGSRLPPQ